MIAFVEIIRRKKLIMKLAAIAIIIAMTAFHALGGLKITLWDKQNYIYDPFVWKLSMCLSSYSRLHRYHVVHILPVSVNAVGSDSKDYYSEKGDKIYGTCY